MQDLGLYRALAGGAGLAACIALLADQARADAIDFVPPAPVAIAALHAPVTLSETSATKQAASYQGRLTDSPR